MMIILLKQSTTFQRFIFILKIYINLFEMNHATITHQLKYRSRLAKFIFL